VNKKAYLEKSGREWFIVEEFKGTEGNCKTFLGNFGNRISSEYDGAKLVQEEDEKSLGKVTMEMELKGSEQVKGELEGIEAKAQDAFDIVDKLANRLRDLTKRTQSTDES